MDNVDKYSKYIHKSYRLTREAVYNLEEMTLRLSMQAGFDLSMAKVLELLIMNNKDIELYDLIKKRKIT